MSLINQNWTTFSGEPIGGRVPPRLLVHGPALTKGQFGEVSRLYNAFCTANQLALGQFQAQNRILSDGSVVRMVSINRVDTIQVWTRGGAGVYEVYRGLAYAAFTSQEGATFTFKTYGPPYEDTPNNYGTEDFWFGGVTPAPEKKTVARLVAKSGPENEQVYGDSVRGILEGNRVGSGNAPTYWVREHRLAGGEDEWVDTDEVWTNSGGIIFVNNKAVAAYTPDPGGLSMEAIAFPFENRVIVASTTGRVSTLALVKDPLRFDQRGLPLEHGGSGSEVFLTTQTTLANPTFVPWDAPAFVQPAVSQKGDRFAICTGGGWLKEYTIAKNPSTGLVEATLGQSINDATPADSGSAQGNGTSFSTNIDLSTSATVGAAYVNGTLTTLAATSTRTVAGAITFTPKPSDGVAGHATLVGGESRLTTTLNGLPTPLVLRDRHVLVDYDVFSSTREFHTEVGLYFYFRGTGTLNSTVVDVQREPLLIDAHNGIMLYTERRLEQSRAINNDEAWFPSGGTYNDVAILMHGAHSLWSFSEGVCNLEGALAWSPLQGYPIFNVTTDVFYEALVLSTPWGTFTHKIDYETGLTTTATLGPLGDIVAPEVVLAAPLYRVPTMQGMCPQVAYRLVDAESPELVASHGQTSASAELDVVNFALTEAGVEDWLTSCGVPPATALRYANCFRVGGPGRQRGVL